MADSGDNALLSETVRPSVFLTKIYIWPISWGASAIEVSKRPL
jgi:hypothetical protein